MPSQKTSKISFNFKFWIPLFILLLACIPIFTMMGQKTLAKVTGVSTVVLTAFAIRRWLYFAQKMKGKPNKIDLNINDRYWLSEHIYFYGKLTSSEKKTFENRIALFLTEIIVTEVGEEVPSRETCLYVACSAVIAFWGLPYWNYGRLSEVLVYPDNFTDNNEIEPSGNIQGKVHKGGLMDTTMILSLPALISGYKNPFDKKNVGIHEFAHLIDKSDGEIDGVPTGLDLTMKKHWLELFSIEFLELSKKNNEINAYGFTDLPEFFAVLVEYYKESPDLLKKRHSELFELIDKYFTK